jgi:hypothetical protein
MLRAGRFPRWFGDRWGSRDGARALAGLLVACGVLLAALGGRTAVGAPAGKSTVFTGRILAGTGRLANLRGAVRLTLAATAGGVPAATPSPSPHAFTLVLSAPPCARQGIRAPRRCASLSGKLTGTALSAPRNPDVGTTFVLNARGRVGPLGQVTATGTTSGVGFIARGRFPLSLRLRSAAAGTLTISAHGPQVRGFSSPF